MFVAKQHKNATIHYQMMQIWLKIYKFIVLSNMIRRRQVKISVFLKFKSTTTKPPYDKAMLYKKHKLITDLLLARQKPFLPLEKKIFYIKLELTITNMYYSIQENIKQFWIYILHILRDFYEHLGRVRRVPHRDWGKSCTHKKQHYRTFKSYQSNSFGALHFINPSHIKLAPTPHACFTLSKDLSLTKG